MKKRSRMLIALTAMLSMFGGAVVFAAPASAAVYYCNDVQWSSSLREWVPYSTSGGTSSCYMNATNKTRGTAVRHLQDTMNECYNENLNEDGVFGDATRRALIRTQGKIGATADGRYGPETRNKMNWVGYSNGIPQPYC